MKNVLKDFFYPYKMIKINLRGMIAFELMYRLLSMLVFFPSLVGIERLLLLVNRHTNITAYNAKSIFYNPLTYLVLLLMVCAIGVYVMIEQFALSTAIHAAYSGVRLTGGKILSEGITLTAKYFRPKNVMLLIFVLLIIPVTTILDSSSITKFFSVPGFIRESIDKYWYYQVLYYICIAAAVIFALRWFFSIIVMAVENTDTFPAAQTKSKALTKGPYKLKLILMNVIWAILVTLVTTLLTFLLASLVFLAAFWITGGSPSVYDTFITKDGFQIVVVVCSFFVGWISTPLLLTSYQGAYYRRMKALGHEIPPYRERESFLRSKKFIKPLIIIACGVSIFVSVPFRFSQIKWMMNTGAGLPMIMAHRGYSATAPENTIEAMEAAIDLGIQAVEFDVQMTKDGEIVLLHDNSLNRTTGYNAKIWDVTYEEIKDLDASVGFRKETGLSYPVTHFPTLDATLKAVKGKLYCNIEIKRTGHDDGIEKKVVEIIRENDFLDNCDITSQDYETMLAVRKANPDVLTAYTTIISMGDVENLEAADIISINNSFATFREVDRLRASGKKVFVWIVNDENTMEKLISLNVDAILTNDPDLGEKVLENHGTPLADISNRLAQILWVF